MKITKILMAVVLTALTTSAAAQYSQSEKSSQFMLKLELGYAPFMTNVGQAGEHGFNIFKFHNAAGLNAMAGANLSQDWFIGGGLGFNYYHSTHLANVQPMMGVNLFADVDFRPLWQGLMGLDYQPATIKWAPMAGLRVGVSMLLDQPDYGSPITPLIEAYGGVNWFYQHGLRNMGHNWHALYATFGVAYLQQTVYLPLRIGWRW